jgi:hypothetical protein
VATTVASAFDIFLGRLTPTPGETAAAKAHRESIRQCLESRFEITNFFRTGSFGHGTSVRGFSDVDCFAVVPTVKLTRNSDTTLGYFRDALDARFPRTGVKVRGPAVIVPFGKDGAESTEVIPADYVGKSSKGKNVYDIPNRAGGWMRSSPSGHNAWVDDIDQKLSGRVKPLIRIVKAWKYQRAVPVHSFYLELRVAAWAAHEKAIVYSLDVRGVLKHLDGLGLASMVDPIEVAGRVAASGTDVQLADAKSKLTTALTRAEKARVAELTDHPKEAFQWWDLVFNGTFPAYG